MLLWGDGGVAVQVFCLHVALILAVLFPFQQIYLYLLADHSSLQMGLLNQFLGSFHVTFHQDIAVYFYILILFAFQICRTICKTISNFLEDHYEFSLASHSTIPIKSLFLNIRTTSFIKGLAMHHNVLL